MFQYYGQYGFRICEKCDNYLVLKNLSEKSVWSPTGENMAGLMYAILRGMKILNVIDKREGVYIDK